MLKDVLIEIDEIYEEEGIDEETNVSAIDMLKKVFNKRVTQFKENGGIIDDKSLKNIADEFISDTFEISLEELRAMD